ncbi:lysophospholipid acyltransferase family protein [Isosphaeraceae bacterium EP7]
MDLVALLVASAGMLLAPRLMMPRVRPRPEIHGLLTFIWWINATYCTLWHHLDPTVKAPLPARGPAILIANHTSAIDHFLLQVGARRVLGFMIAREFYDNRLYHPICKLLGCIPVKRDGRDLGATRAALRALADGRVVPLFPEGKITAQSGRVIGEGRSGVAYLALKAKVPVIPAYLHGTPESNEFVACLIAPSQSRVVYGPAVDLSDFDAADDRDHATLIRATERLMGAIHALKNSVEEARNADGDTPATARSDSGTPALSQDAPAAVTH